MNKSVLIVPIVALLLALSTKGALAGGIPECQPIYGGGETCIKSSQFEINKTVKDPKTGTFVDSLGVSNPKYKSNETVTFKITVKNTGGSVLKNVVIKDTLPDFVDFVDGQGGKFDPNTKTLTIDLETLASNESRDFFVQVKVKRTDQLPKNQNTICVVNQSTITVDAKTSQDNSQFCIEKGTVAAAVTSSNPTTTKGGLPVYPPTKATTMPSTGPESLALFGLIPSAGAGFFLRRKSK